MKINWKAILLAIDTFLLALVHGDKVEYNNTMNTEISPEIVMAPIQTPIVPEKTNGELLYEFAATCLGKDIAKTQNELGCAEAVSYLLIHLKCPDFPSAGFLSTTILYEWMLKNFVKLNGEDVAQPGDIIISPTGTAKDSQTHGHVGIIAKEGILSNNSMTGLFDEYYTIEKWNAYYVTKLGFPVLFFRWL